MARRCCRPCITVKCVTLGQVVWGISPAFFVQARNSCGEIVFEGCTGKCGSVRFPIGCDLEYKISVYAPAGFSPRVTHRWIRPSQEHDRHLCFAFSMMPPCCSFCRTISLTDQYYTGLPISKGEISLWQVPM